MKKLIALAFIAAVAAPVFAQEPANSEKEAPQQEEKKSEDQNRNDLWPAPFAVCEWPNSLDVIGLRITIPFSTVQDSVTGIDVGFWGHSMFFEGIQANIIRNDVVDGMSGFQAGLYNSIGRGEMLGIQVGLWNEAMSMRGVQAGLVNVIGEGEGLQVGLVNRAETLYGYQIGIINVIRDAELQFMPVINVGF